MEYSILNDNKRVKYDKIMFLKRFDSEQYKLVTLQKPGAEIESLKWFGKIQEAKATAMDKTLAEWQGQWEKLGERINDTLTAQDKILKVLDSLISDEYKTKGDK